MRKIIIVAVSSIIIIGCSKFNKGDETSDGNGSLADRFTTTFVEDIIKFEGDVGDPDKDGVFTVKINMTDGNKTFGMSKNSDCSDKYREIAEKFGDTAKKEYYYWGTSTPPTEVIIAPTTINLVCTNRDIDKDHKKNQSLSDITKISLLPYDEFIKSGVKNLGYEYRDKELW